MSEELDQTGFVQELQFQPVQGAATPTQPAEQPKPSSRRKILMIGALTLVFSILVVAWLMTTSTQTLGPEATPTPQPTESSTLGTGLSAEIAPLLNAATQADPDENNLSFPPVNFDLSIEKNSND